MNDATRTVGAIHVPVLSSLTVGVGDDSAMVAFMQGPGAALTHTPDIVILGLEAPNVYTCIEVKTFDPTGPTHVSTHHTDTTRLGAHTAVERASRRDEYRLIGPRALPPLPAHLRTHGFLPHRSVFGSISPSGHRLLSLLSRRTDAHVPFALMPAVTWAAPRVAPFARMACGLAIRRGLAEYVRMSWSQPAAPLPPPIPPPLALPGVWPPLPAPAAHAAVAASLFG